MQAPTAIEVVWLVAIAHVWARGTIFKWLREHGPAVWRSLAGCPLCSGFWIGVLGHVVYVGRPAVVVWLGLGSLVGTLALAVCALVRRL